MKKTYVTPETEICEVALDDIITSSLTYQASGDGGYIDGSTIL